MAYQPSNASIASDVVKLRQCSRFSQEFVLDRVVKEMFRFPNIGTTDGIVGLLPGTGHPVLTEINSSGVTGLLLNADNEGYYHLWRIPAECDVTQPISFSYEYAGYDAYSAIKTCLFVTKYTPIISGTTALATISSGTALDTVHTVDTPPVQYAYAHSTWGTIAANKTGVKTLTCGDDALQLKIYVDVTSTYVYLIGGRVRYYRKYVG